LTLPEANRKNRAGDPVRGGGRLEVAPPRQEEVAAMSAVNCPMCELRFPSRNERDWHLRNEHEHMHVHRPADQTEIWWRRSSRDVHQQERPPTG
jgi:hypothetical protein